MSGALQRERGSTLDKNRIKSASFGGRISRRRFLELGGVGLAGATLLGVAGCGGAGSGQDGNSVDLTFAHSLPTGHPHHRCGAEPLAQRLAKENTGLNIKVSPNSALGDEAEQLESLVAGNLDMAIINSSFLASYYEPLNALSAAYLFEGVDHLMEATNGEVGQEMWEKVRQEANVRVLGSWYYGTRQFTASKPIRSPEDLAGVKVRAAEADIWIANVKMIGGNPTPMALPELYLGLQQGTVDAQENPIPTIDANKYYEVQSHLSLTKHVLQANQIVMSEPAWQSLSGDQRQALTEAVVSIGGKVRECIEEADAEILERWQSENTMEIIDDVNIEAFKQRVGEALPEQFSGEFLDLYERIQDAG